MLPWMPRLNGSGPAGVDGESGGFAQCVLRCVASALVVDRLLDHRLGEDSGEHEREQPAERPDPEAAEDEPLFHELSLA